MQNSVQEPLPELLVRGSDALHLDDIYADPQDHGWEGERPREP